jgi:ABC-type nickel/cobalt efflux system permease component RcnA
MLYVVFGEIIPQSLSITKSRLTTYAALVGILVGLIAIFVFASPICTHDHGHHLGGHECSQEHHHCVEDQCDHDHHHSYCTDIDCTHVHENCTDVDCTHAHEGYSHGECEHHLY